MVHPLNRRHLTQLVGVFLIAVGLGASSRPATAQERPLRQPDINYLPTPQPIVEKMLEVANVTKDDVVYDLGSGDGRIVITAAQKYGCKAVGIELDARLVRESRDNARRASVEKLVTIRQEDIFTTDLSDATVVTLYLLPSLNVKLIPQFEKLKPGTRIVSHRFDMRGVTPDKMVWATAPGWGNRELYLWTTPLKKTAEATATASSDRRVSLTVRVPAEADLEIEGVKMKSRGETRYFESPLLEASKQYTYTLRATWTEAGKTREVQREVTVQAGQPYALDLREKLLQQKEVDYNGRSLGDWIRLLKSPKVEERRAAAEALHVLSWAAKAEAKVAVPPLIDLFKNKEEDSEVRSKAALALGEMGSDARAAIPVFVQELEDFGGLHSMAAQALGDIGREAKGAIKPAIPVLIKCIKGQGPDFGQDHTLRVLAARALGQVGPEAHAAVPALIEVLKVKDGSDPVRPLAPGQPREDLGEFSLRAAAADALGNMGPAARVAVPTLVETLKDEKVGVRINAAYTLWRIEKHQTAVPTLVQVLKDRKNSEAAARAARVLGAIGPEAKVAVPALIEAMKHPMVLREAIDALGAMGPEAKAAVPALREALGKGDLRAAKALWQIDKNEAGFLALVEALKDQDSTTRWQAADALADLGPAAKSAVPALIKALADKEVRVTAARALAEIGPDAKDAVPVLVEALGDGDFRVRKFAAEALKKIDPGAAAKAGVK